MESNIGNYDKDYRTRVVAKLMKSWERYDLMDYAQEDYKKGMYEFLIFISTYLSDDVDVNMLTQKEEFCDPERTEWDFTKQDKEYNSRVRLNPGYDHFA